MSQSLSIKCNIYFVRGVSKKLTRHEQMLSALPLHEFNVGFAQTPSGQGHTVQRRQSGLKTGGVVDPGEKKFLFFQAISPK